MKNETRLKKLEQANKSEVFLIRVTFVGEEQKPPEQEMVYPVIDGKTVPMTYKRFLELYPDYIDETEHITVTYEGEGSPYAES